MNDCNQASQDSFQGVVLTSLERLESICVNTQNQVDRNVMHSTRTQEGTQETAVAQETTGSQRTVFNLIQHPTIVVDGKEHK